MRPCLLSVSMLNRSNLLREQEYISGDKREPLDKAEIAAAAQLSCAYFGYKTALKFDKDVKIADIERFQEELIRL